MQEQTSTGYIDQILDMSNEEFQAHVEQCTDERVLQSCASLQVARVMRAQRPDQAGILAASSLVIMGAIVLLGFLFDEGPLDLETYLAYGFASLLLLGGAAWIALERSRLKRYKRITSRLAAFEGEYAVRAHQRRAAWNATVNRDEDWSLGLPQIPHPAMHHQVCEGCSDCEH